MSKFMSAPFYLLLLGSVSAFASFPGNPRSITWEELKVRCAHPEDTDVQRAPQNIRIQCSESRLAWENAEPGQLPLLGRKLVTTAVFSDKFFVNAQQHQLPEEARTGSCQRFKEVQEVMTIERRVTCAEIVSGKGELENFCEASLNAARASNPKLVDKIETGKMIDTCARRMD